MLSEGGVSAQVVDGALESLSGARGDAWFHYGA
jgi:hypothetical protein